MGRDSATTADRAGQQYGFQATTAVTDVLVIRPRSPREGTEDGHEWAAFRLMARRCRTRRCSGSGRRRGIGVESRRRLGGAQTAERQTVGQTCDD